MRYDVPDVFRPLSDESQLEINPYIQGAPILLPANRTYLGKFSFEGKDYELPITEERSGSHLHGLVHRQEFSLVECNSKSVTLKYSNRREVYSFDFDMLVTYETAEDVAGYICIEPQAGKVNGLNIDGGCVILSPGEEHTYFTKIKRK